MQPTTQPMLTYRDGSMQPFMSVYDAVKQPLYAFCLRLAGSEDEAADAVQEAFIRLLNSAGDITGSGAVKSWLYATARNQIYNEFRREGRLTEFEDEGFASENTPYTDAERNDEAEFFLKLIADLPLFHREVLMLREYEGYSYDDMSKMLGVPESTIKMRLFKARKQLAKRFNRTDPTR